MTSYPIFYSFRCLVEGNGYVAGVAFENAQALASMEGADDWWAYGVRPAATAASGRSISEAFSDLRDGLRKYLFDVAAESPDFESFQREVRRFFDERTSDVEQEWDASVAEMRAGKAAPEGLGKVASTGVVPRIGIEEIKRPAASKNAVDERPAVAA